MWCGVGGQGLGRAWLRRADVLSLKGLLPSIASLVADQKEEDRYIAMHTYTACSQLCCLSLWEGAKQIRWPVEVKSLVDYLCASAVRFAFIWIASWALSASTCVSASRCPEEFGIAAHAGKCILTNVNTTKHVDPSLNISFGFQVSAAHRFLPPPVPPLSLPPSCNFSPPPTPLP